MEFLKLLSDIVKDNLCLIFRTKSIINKESWQFSYFLRLKLFSDEYPGGPGGVPPAQQHPHPHTLGHHHQPIQAKKPSSSFAHLFKSTLCYGIVNVCLWDLQQEMEFIQDLMVTCLPYTGIAFFFLYGFKNDSKLRNPR